MVRLASPIWLPSSFIASRFLESLSEFCKFLTELIPLLTTSLFPCCSKFREIFAPLYYGDPALYFFH